LLTLTSLTAGAFAWVPRSVPALALLAQMLFAVALSGRVQRALVGLGGRSRDLFQLAELIACVEKEPFTASGLKALQAELIAGRAAVRGNLAAAPALAARPVRAERRGPEQRNPAAGGQRLEHGRQKHAAAGGGRGGGHGPGRAAGAGGAAAAVAAGHRGHAAR